MLCQKQSNHSLPNQVSVVLFLLILLAIYLTEPTYSTLYYNELLHLGQLSEVRCVC